MKDSSGASAPAKAILFGEHFVVYDKLAIAIALDIRARVAVKPRPDKKIVVRSSALGSSEFTLDGHGGNERLKPVYAAAKGVLSMAGERMGLDLTVDSQIPISSGLGSSAAVLVATTAAVGDLLEMRLTSDDIFRLALDAERLVHENPSGVDPAIATYGGVLAYRRSEGAKRLKVDLNLPLVLGDTRIKRDTREMVMRVSEIRRLYPGVFEEIIDAGDKIARLALGALGSGDLVALGRLMDMNHALLCALGVSNKALEDLVWAARRAGAFGAKITGAGGGGCIIALAPPWDIGRVAEAIRSAGGEPMIAGIAQEGVRIEG